MILYLVIQIQLVTAVMDKTTGEQRDIRFTPIESVIQYVAALRDSASKCEFGPNTDDIVGDQLIERNTPDAVDRRRLKPPALNLHTRKLPHLAQEHLHLQPTHASTVGQIKNCQKNGHSARVCQSADTGSLHKIALPEYTVCLRPPAAHLVKYSQGPIPVLECLPATVSREAATCAANL
ncbi:hypothetical protein E1301_Tti017053 [Triplophysa tibetana]|uniref:Uncharacterized protein n=1 Tax=Triplophysa tibetana TaxID=1572043 RepID=A0A5A9MZW3_9TELE|nr:hypothetical protein E1301_Tti017053 [Triplophysa tibetana]